MSDQMHRRDLFRLASAALLALNVAGRDWAFTPELLQSVGQQPAWQPLFFNLHQKDTVIAITDLLIPATDTPGAKQAKVYRYIDLFLSVKSAADQRHFTEGLAFVDRYAYSIHGHEFVACSEQEQIDILTRLGAQDQAASQSGKAFFTELKDLAAAIYYATLEGHDDLNQASPPPASFGCIVVSARS